MDTQNEFGSFGEGPEISDQEMDQALRQIQQSASTRTRNLRITAVGTAIAVFALGALVLMKADSGNKTNIAAKDTTTTEAPTTSTTMKRTTTTLQPVAVVTTQTLTGKSSELKVPWKFVFPQVSGLKTTSVDKRINQAIRDQFTSNLGQIDQGTYYGGDGSDTTDPAYEGDDYGTGNPTNYQVTSKVKRNDSKIFSVEFDVVEDFQHEAHPSSSTYSMTFNATTGNPVDLKDLFSNEQGALNAAAIYAKSILNQHKNDDWCVENIYGADPNEYSYNIFFPEKDGFHVLFDYDTVSCHAGGTREITIPWSKVDNYLSDYGTTITN
jgi:hypothetical protein